MTDQTIQLTDEQRREIPAMLSVGCSRSTAADYTGCTPEMILDAAGEDESFAAQLRRAEAGAELTHLRNVHEACKDPKNWRASIWMLERRYPHRYAKRRADVVTQNQLEEVILQMAQIILAESPDDDHREKLLQRFERLAASRHDETD